MFLFEVSDQRVCKLFSVAAREALLAAWASHCEVVHTPQSHRFAKWKRACTSSRPDRGCPPGGEVTYTLLGTSRHDDEMGGKGARFRPFAHCGESRMRSKRATTQASTVEVAKTCRGRYVGVQTEAVAAADVVVRRTGSGLIPCEPSPTSANVFHFHQGKPQDARGATYCGGGPLLLNKARH